MTLPYTSPSKYASELRTEYEDRLIKSLDSNDLQSLKKILRQLAEIGTTKSLQYLERYDYKGKFPGKIFDFTKAIIAARHQRPYQLQLEECEIYPPVPGNGDHPVHIERSDRTELSNIIEHHLNTSYNFNLHSYDGYNIRTAGEQLLLLLDKGRDSKLSNTLLDRRSMVGMVYCHCRIRLAWCLAGMVFTEPAAGGLNFNVFNPDGEVILTGYGKQVRKSIKVIGRNTSVLDECETSFELLIRNNDFSLVEGWVRKDKSTKV